MRAPRRRSPCLIQVTVTYVIVKAKYRLLHRQRINHHNTINRDNSYHRALLCFLPSSLPSQEKRKNFPIATPRPLPPLSLPRLPPAFLLTMGKMTEATFPTRVPSKLALYPYDSIRIFLPCRLPDYEIKPDIKAVTTAVDVLTGAGWGETPSKCSGG